MTKSINGKIIVLISALVLIGVQNVCFGQAAVEASNNDTKHKHDGFYFHLAPGFGGTAIGEVDERDELIISGGSSNTKIGIGYALVENLIVSLDIFGSVLVDPEVEINGQELGEADAELTIANVGLGMTYYLMPSNFYLSGSIGLATGELETDFGTFDTDLGYGINFALGKEWWVSDNWGLGVATHLYYSSLPDENSIGEVSYLNTASIGILFSATFN
ncbi:hypothetical protein C6501_02695 [Candidatus Poribacteria bacterium]|nr:MAG: hypothetical protein C6501_02695 [Candidatus Poribacteria bacterium]